MIDHPSKRGFSLMELLVVIAIILVLSGLTLASLRAARHHQLLEHAVASIQADLDYARVLAMSEGESVYWIVAGEAIIPESAGYIGHALVRRLDNLEWIKSWSFLPKGWCFAPDTWESAGDLLATPLLDDLDVTSGMTGNANVSGRAVVLMEARPDGRFYVGNPPRAVPGHMALVRGSWFRGTSPWRFDVWDDPKVAGQDLDAMRIRIRPLTGVTRSERILP